MKSLNGGIGMTDEQVKAYVVVDRIRIRANHRLTRDLEFNRFIDRYIPGYIFFSDGIESGYNTTPGGDEDANGIGPPWKGSLLRITIDDERAVIHVERS